MAGIRCVLWICIMGFGKYEPLQWECHLAWKARRLDGFYCCCCSNRKGLFWFTLLKDLIFYSLESLLWGFQCCIAVAGMKDKAMTFTSWLKEEEQKRPISIGA